jgi:hypothetical protein
MLETDHDRQVSTQQVWYYWSGRCRWRRGSGSACTNPILRAPAWFIARGARCCSWIGKVTVPSEACHHHHRRPRVSTHLYLHHDSYDKWWNMMLHHATWACNLSPPAVVSHVQEEGGVKREAHANSRARWGRCRIATRCTSYSHNRLRRMLAPSAPAGRQATPCTAPRSS